MIFAAWLVWNEEKLLGESINSVIKYVDHCIFIDGAFRSNLKAVKDNKPNSTDRTKELVHALVDSDQLTWIEAKDFWENEGTKRSAYCKVFNEQGKTGDWLLWMDADEVCIGNKKAGFYYLRNINAKMPGYVPHWVWVQSVYPMESPSHPLGDEWTGYKHKYDLTTQTYFDMGRRINILPYLGDIFYIQPLQPYVNSDFPKPLRPIKAYTQKFFMLYNRVWMRSAKELTYRLERSMIERPHPSGSWRNLSWASQIIDDMEKKYDRKVNI